MNIRLGTLAIIALSAGAAKSETVTTIEHSINRNGFPCFATLSTDANKKITLQLSDYKDVWAINFIISDRASIYRRFFDSQGLRDENAFADAFSEVRIGESTFDFNSISLFETSLHDVDEKSAGIFSIEEQHNVARALEAMASDGVNIEGLVSLDGTVEALSEFRSCSYTAMGLQEGEQVETDFRAEYRMIFEGAFENWVTSMAKADHCSAVGFDEGAVSEVVDAAADAFYPGFLNLRKRSEYRDDLVGMMPIAKLSGMVSATTEGCLMAGRLADVSRLPVDKAIEEASKLD